MDLAHLPQLEACLANFLVDNGFSQLITEPTCFNKTLDLLIVNDQLNTGNIAVVSPISTSGHNAIT